MTKCKPKALKKKFLDDVFNYLNFLMSNKKAKITNEDTIPQVKVAIQATAVQPASSPAVTAFLTSIRTDGEP